MSNQPSSSLAQKLKQLDHHSSVSSEFRVKTFYGAILSSVTLLLVAYLTLTEFSYNLTPTLREKVHVNATTSKGIEMEFDVTFPSVPCALLSIDADDPMHQRQSMHIDAIHRLWKHRMDKDGNLIGKKSKLEMGKTLKEERHLEDFANEKDIKFEENMDADDAYYGDEETCGSCYGAAEDGECCNTCDDVKRAYQRKGWHFEKDIDVKQCKTNVGSREMDGEGCNVHGKVFDSLQDFINQAFETFNVSHTVNKLRFGDAYPGDIHQLDGSVKMVQDAYGMYQYYIQIVPTEYTFLNGTKIQSNQYSVTEHMRHVSPGSNRGLPGVYFYYEVSPLHVEIEEYRHGWIRFFTSVAAVVGGDL
eukprot:scaffold161_cov206-Chaetoceros_neogracile.AAC.5